MTISRLDKALIAVVAVIAATAVGVTVVFLRSEPEDAEKPAVAGFVQEPGGKTYVWYVDPRTQTRAFIGSAADMQRVMETMALGSTSADIDALDADAEAARKFRGQMLLDVGRKGAAWYVDPTTSEAYALGASDAAFAFAVQLAHPIEVNWLRRFPVALKSPSWLTVPEGYAADIAATHFNHPRVLGLDPEGRLAVSDFGEKSSVSILQDEDGDGSYESRRQLVRNLFNGHGFAFMDGYLFVAREHWLERWDYDPERMRVSASSNKRLMQLVSGAEQFAGQGHKTRTVVPDGNGNLLLSVGSLCDHCINFAADHHAVILKMDAEGGNMETFATGLRNTVFFAQDPSTGRWWGNDMGQDNLGNDVPRDEVNELTQGGNYGWPFCYEDRKPVPDQSSPELCRDTIAPSGGYPAHSAPLGIRFAPAAFGDDVAGDMFSALHGSTVKDNGRIGYKVVKTEMRDGAPAGEPVPFIEGFLRDDDSILGRPVDLLFSPAGNTLYITDDFAGVLHRVTKVAL